MGSPAIEIPPLEERDEWLDVPAETIPLENKEETPNRAFNYPIMEGCNITPGTFPSYPRRTVAKYDSGIEVHSWSDITRRMKVDFGEIPRTFVKAREGDCFKVLTLMDKTPLANYHRSLVRYDDHINILYIPQHLLTQVQYNPDDSE